MTRRKPKPSRQRSKPVNHGLRIATTAQRDHLTALHRSGQLDELCTTARRLLKDCPDDAFVWTALGSSLLKQQRYEEAQEALSMADKLFPGDQQILDGLTKAQAWLGDHQQAIANQQRSLEIDPDNAAGHFHLASLLHERGDIKALEHLNRAEALGHNLGEVLSLRGNTSSAKFKFHDALQAFRKLIDIAPNSPEALNNLANTLKDMGEFREAEATYLKALEINPKHMPAYSNLFFSMHYDPERSAEEILEFAQGWEERFPPSKTFEHPAPEKTMAARPVRIGLLSGGLCAHPVGQMIAVALEHTDDSLEVYAYSTNQIRDHITERIVQCVDSWQTIGHLNDEQLADKIHQDDIDILIDLNGHGAGNRLKSVSMRPAPLIVKWVGGLVGSMGLSSFDYLISDCVETPAGVDHLYVEKLIRLPDDYICYLPSEAISPITMLPAVTNGYVTLGCFNNPAKINPVLLAEWAKLMHQLPNCRLLLKGAQYDSPEFCERIRGIMREHGISDERLILEGPSKHHELLKAYNRVDIALDPWPYSGGLTTCEAMLMGVPVVTFPGPTFAGRHSATHLVNAGMPELVVDSWDEYRQRVIELANDLPNLSVIRACLRRVLIESPVCDGPRFARHFTTAMRAIWQRYCEGKVPAALSISKDGSAQFAGEDNPTMLIPLAPPPIETSSADTPFQWEIEGKIVTLDHGAVLTCDPIFTELQKTNSFAAITFDPSSKVSNITQLQRIGGELHHYPKIALGDGREATMFSCAAPAMSATLEPLPAEQQLPGNQESTQVVAKLSIPTLRLDDIEGLENIDWLLLDNMSDSLVIMENGEKALTNTLLVQVRINFSPTHKSQPELYKISDWLVRHGFSFYRLNNLSHISCLPKRYDLVNQQATQLAWADALFLPNENRMATLADNQLLKLALVLHHVYGIQDLTTKLLTRASPDLADRYLTAQKLIKKDINDKNNSHKYPTHTETEKHELLRINFNDNDNTKIKIDLEQKNDTPLPAPSIISGKTESSGRFVHICFNNMHIQQFINLIQKKEARAGFEHSIYIERTRSIPDYDVNIRNVPEATYFDSTTQLEQVIQNCLTPDVLGVFFHGLFFDWQKKIIRQLGNQKKLIWVVWGGDLYTPIKNKQKTPEVDQYIAAVAMFETSEYDIFCKHYTPKKLIPMKYDFEFEENAHNQKKENIIFVGNSGDPSNNHIEILREIAKKRDAQEYKIVIPFSYNGTPEYLEAVKKEARTLSLENIEFIEKMLPKHEYLKLLERAKLIITAHNRQQALGNITAAIYYGTNVVTKRKISVDGKNITNPTWEHMTVKNKIHMTAYEEFEATKSIKELLATAENKSAKNHEKIKAIYGSDAIMELTSEAFKKAKNI